MNKKYFTILLNPLFIAIYSFGLYVLYRFLWLGNVKKRLPVLIVIFSILLIWIILWTIYYFKHKNSIKLFQKTKHIHIYLGIELALILSLTGYCGYRVYQIAQPFTGKLGNYLYDKKNSKDILLVHHNYKQTGLEGILADINKEVELPEELYVSNYLEIVYDEDGYIHSLYTFLYGKDKNENTRSYLINFDLKKGNMMTVWIDGYTKTPFVESDLLSKMHKTTNQDENGLYHDKWTKNKSLQNQEKKPENYKAGELVKDQNGDLHYYLDKEKVYSLVVVDAAAGSRAYKFVGQNITNEDPFQGKMGVATDIHFEDENNGYIVLSNASGDYFKKYVTSDGGKTFILVE